MYDKIAVLDFETFWDSKTYTLSRMGPLEYVRDPRFVAQMLAVCLNREAPVVHVDEASIAHALHELEDAAIIGHNLAGFDALIISERFGIHPRHLWDTIGMMNWTGVSRLVRRSHAALTKFFGTGVKKEGTVVSDGKRWPDDFTQAERAYFAQYCADDATQCRDNARRMIPYMTEDALRFLSITARMATEPAFELDERMLVDYIVQLDEAVAKARQDIMSVFRFPDEASFLKAVRSAPQFCVMLRHLGVEPPMKESAAKTATLRTKLEAELAQARTDEELAAVRTRMDQNLPVMTPALSKQDIDFLALREHEDPRVRLLVEARLEHNSSISRSRAERFLAFARHGRPVPVMLSAFNAHTSRYTAGAADEDASSDRLQFQNLSKRDPSKAVLRKAIKAPAGHKVVACDSSQVEARCLAWVAGQNDLVEQFRHGRDPYSELAADIFGVPHEDIHAGAKSGDKRMKTYRNVGKTCILSAGYGVGAKKFADTLVRQGAKLDADIDKHNELAFHAHNVYRMKNAAIVAFWKTCGNVIDMLANGMSGTFGGPDNTLFKFGPCTVCGVEDVPSIVLPSGFAIRYPHLRYETSDGRGSYVYDRPKGANTQTIRIYGGAVTENIIQSFAFQILMWQACRMDEAGISIKCNIHDSFATVVPETQAEQTAKLMEQYMSMCPPWAVTLPIACESEIGDDFGVV